MARLTTKARNALPASDFAGPNRTFPVEDKAHAKAAIGLSGHASNPGAIKARARKVLHNTDNDVPAHAKHASKRGF